MPQISSDADYSKTWILFEGGTSVAVDLSLYSPPRETNRPIDAYLVTECGGDFTGSARRAAEAVYNMAKRFQRDLKPVVVGYDLHGLSARQAVTGESCGLAFALALAKRVFKHDPGPVAATGEVISGHGGGPLGPVKGIVSKLEGAMSLIPENSWIFYPKENDADIPAGLRKSLSSSGFRLRPVSSVNETLEQLFDLKKKGVSGRHRGILLTGVLILLISIIAAAAVFVVKDRKTSLKSSVSETNIPPKFHIQAKNEIPAPDPAISEGLPKVHIQTKPETPAADSAIIDLKGKGIMGRKIAGALTLELDKLLKQDSGKDLYVSGEIEIITVSEQTVNKKGYIRSKMTVAVRGLKMRSDRSQKTVPLLRADVEGKGNADLLIPPAALALTKKIAAALDLSKPKRRLETNGTHGVAGFD